MEYDEMHFQDREIKTLDESLPFKDQSTIFIPLTFITGIYGMNFKYMPELVWRWGYPVVWLFMIGIGVAMLVYFRKRKWL